jgi:hypothetical protein
MYKLLGGVLLGVFVGALMIEILKRRRPELVARIERQAKSVMDKLFENMRETYDFRRNETDAEAGPDA